MPKLPIISGKDLIKRLNKYGYVAIRQKGSHVRLINEKSDCKSITIPLHKIIKPGLLHKILRDANLSLEDFLNL
jgi:predicted RNA binding protein YcfA (HicA-like mRNA interferase family)